MKKRWMIILFLAFSVIIFPLNRSMAQGEVKIGYLGFVLALPTFVALEKGYFQEQGLKVTPTLFESGTIITDALITGRVDIQTGSAVIASWLAEQNMPGTYKIFIMYGARETPQDNTMALMVTQDSPMKGIADLKGKRMGTFPGIASIALAKAVLRNSFDPNKEITLIEVPPGNIVQALAAGQVDAYFAPEPFGMIGEAKGVARRLIKNPLLLLNLKTGIPGAPFSFNSKFVKEKPLLAKKVKAAYYKAIDFIYSNEAEARKLLPKYTNLPEPFAMKIPWEHWVKVEEYNKSWGQPYFELLMKEGLFQKQVDTSKLFYQE
ncbi:MAG TPA: ABC transporter substrate-binding protein [Thermodesulfobacteriota bacterium]|nr:ABC transporter substrate-binding protein [Thermodesulfobacteriota bacterium]